jgi:hypothetical protein
MLSALELLVSNMRELGVKSLALELADNNSGLPPEQPSKERPTMAPDAEPEPKEADQCMAPGCADKRGGLFGGAAGGRYCRTHALQLAGVRA